MIKLSENLSLITGSVLNIRLMNISVIFILFSTEAKRNLMFPLYLYLKSNTNLNPFYCIPVRS